jgi:hypothetical protein
VQPKSESDGHNRIASRNSYRSVGLESCSRPVQSSIHSSLQLVSRLVAANGHLLVLDVPPKWLNKVQLRTVRGQVEQLDSCCLQSSCLLPDHSPMMRGIVVQHHYTSLLPDEALWHHSNRRAHAANLSPDELQHVCSLERGSASSIYQPPVRTKGGKSTNSVYSPTLRSFIGHDSAHSFSGPGVTHRQGGKRWSATSVRYILKNSIYMGEWHWNKTQAIVPRRPRIRSRKYDKSSRIWRDRSEWIGIPVPAIISKDLFDAAQRQMQRNKALSKRNCKNDYLFRGYLVCANAAATSGGTSQEAGATMNAQVVIPAVGPWHRSVWPSPRMQIGWNC